MISGLKERSIWLYKPHLDFRKQMNGLIQVVITEMKLMPNDGGIYIFRNRQRDKIKVLMWDRNGFILGYKRLEKGKFDLPSDVAGAIEITWEQLQMIIAGMPVVFLGKTTEKTLYFS